jgi:glycerol-3-phosphate O-acyltransferase
MQFCKEYEAASLKGGNTPNKELFSEFLKAVFEQLVEARSFSLYHKAIRAPVDYYKMGLDFVRPLLDFANSKLLGKEQLFEIQQQCKRGENVFLLANHQTEIDPQIISLLIEPLTPDLAADMVFVAGHRVTTDPLAVPLSLGRNLICIYSKRHIDTPPEKKAEKLKTNQNALAALQKLLDQGGACVFIAPSGGRDRKGPLGNIEVAPFDPDSIEMLLLLAKKAKAKTHFYPLALATYDLLPPPESVLSEIGEKRSTNFAAAHLYFGKPFDIALAENASLEEKRLERQKRAARLWQEVVNMYHSF